MTNVELMNSADFYNIKKMEPDSGLPELKIEDCTIITIRGLQFHVRHSKLIDVLNQFQQFLTFFFHFPRILF